MMLQMARTQDYFWSLGVGREASTAEIDRAYEALAAASMPIATGWRPRTIAGWRRRSSTAWPRPTGSFTIRACVGPTWASWDARTARHPTRRARSTPGPPQLLAPRRAPPSGAAQSLYEVGLEHLRARRHHEAVEVLRQAARLVPNEADYRAALGWALFRQAPGDARAARAAIAELRRATQIDERHRSAAQHLAEIYAQTGQPEAAIAELERLLALDPEAVELADELRRLHGQ